KMSAEEHDRLVAAASHLPQVASTALAAVIGETEGAARVAGPGAVEMTRLAMGSWEIWRDIFATNAGEIEGALDAFIGKLEEMREGLRSAEMAGEFERSGKAARGLRG
ncbi:MAG TPA: prephenate dehydrogenase dimerization domain-containing protein, partial [Bryobacteraceae bacterium]|nr:prephenate dehydrogenase dimerization domain-containing protein [Bryobacteraceae bacterium]